MWQPKASANWTTPSGGSPSVIPGTQFPLSIQHQVFTAQHPWFLHLLCSWCVPVALAAPQVLQLYQCQSDLSQLQFGASAQCSDWLGSDCLFPGEAAPSVTAD